MIHRLCKLILISLLSLLLYVPGPVNAAPVGNPDVSWTGFLSRPSKHTPVWIAYTFITDNKKRLSIRNPRTDMIVTEVDSDDRKRTFIHLQRLLYQTPVWGDQLVIEIDEEGIIRQVTGTVHPDLEKRLFHRPQYPAINARSAAAIAEQWLRSQQLSDNLVGEANICYLPDPTGVRLMYVISTEHGKEIFVHALTGRVLKPDIGNKHTHWPAPPTAA